MQVAPQLAHVVDADLVANRLDDVEIRMRATAYALRVADQLGGERKRGGSFPDSRGPVEEVGVRRPLRHRRAEEALCFRLLRKALEGVHGFAPRSRSPAVSRRRW